MFSEAKASSNYKRLQRFFRGFALKYVEVAGFVLKHVPMGDEGWVVTIDRTIWHLGKTPINILVLGIVWGSVTIPVVWCVLPKKGNSNTGERIDLLDRFLAVVEPEKIAWILADREFIGEDWFGALIDRKIDYSIRIRENFVTTNSRGDLVPVCQLFRGLKPNQVRVLRKPRVICGQALYISGTISARGEYLIVVSHRYAYEAIEQYAQRWTIETLFGCMKTRGFNLEQTHITDPERMERLFALVVIAATWAYAVGEWIEQQTPVKLKKHGRRPVGIFRQGLNFLINIILNCDVKSDPFSAALRVLSCT